MRPKPPAPPSPHRPDTTVDPLAQPPRLRSLLPQPPQHQSPDPFTSRGQNPGHTPPPAGTSEPPRVQISDLPAGSRQTPTSLNGYLLNPGLLRNMQPANEEGLRYIVGRRFVDVKEVGTVYVEFDDSLGTYRAMDLYRKLAPGPALYRNTAETTWSLSRPLKRPHSTNTDSAAVVSGKQPSPEPLPILLKAATTELLNEHFKRLYPQMTHGERVVLLRSYNLSPRQHVRLRDDLIANPLILPRWADSHKLRSMDVNDPTRFDALHQEIEPLLLPLRNGKLLHYDLDGFDESVSGGFLEAFVSKLGYLRNSAGCLYRTDIPGLFRGDERTPFEFFNDGRMLPRYKHRRGATTEKPTSATVSLGLVREYAGYGIKPPDPEHLSYNNQKNRYPGRKPGEPDDEPNESDHEWSEASDIEMDEERNYDTIRHGQQFSFAYVIDTRRMEVVLNEENYLFNNAVRKKGTWFPEDDLEALISTSTKGIASERIWLLDSTFTRAAKIIDIADETDYTSRINIEQRTHQGDSNQYQYDALIDKVALAGKPILTLDRGKEWFANDIVWPE